MLLWSLLCTRPCSMSWASLTQTPKQPAGEGIIISCTLQTTRQGTGRGNYPPKVTQLASSRPKGRMQAL